MQQELVAEAAVKQSTPTSTPSLVAEAKNWHAQAVVSEAVPAGADPARRKDVAEAAKNK